MLLVLSYSYRNMHDLIAIILNIKLVICPASLLQAWFTSHNEFAGFLLKCSLNHLVHYTVNENAKHCAHLMFCQY